MINKIEILQHSESCDFSCDPCKQARGLFGVITQHHQMVIELGKHCLNSLSILFVSPRSWLPVLLVEPIGYFKNDVAAFKEVLLHLRTQIAFVSKHMAIMILPLHVFQVVQVMHIGRSQVIRMDDATGAADGMYLVSIIMRVLRSAVSPCGSAVKIVPTHGAALGAHILADFNRLGINGEHEFTTIHPVRNTFTDFFAKIHCLLASDVKLAPGNEVRDFTRTNDKCSPSHLSENYMDFLYSYY